MGKHLTDKDIDSVVDILDNWSTDSKLTWNRLVEAVQHGFKLETTRQTLEKQVRIKQAFLEVKAIVSGTSAKTVSKSVPPSLKIAQERLEKKDREIARLQRENQQFLEQFHTWLYNASIAGITIEQLNTPLPNKDKM